MTIIISEIESTRKTRTDQKRTRNVLLQIRAMAVISQRQKVFNLSARFFTFPKQKIFEEKTRQQIILHNSNLFAVRRGRRRRHQAENQFCQLLGSRKRKFHDIYWINCLRRRVGNEIIVLPSLFPGKTLARRLLWKNEFLLNVSTHLAAVSSENVRH